MSDEDKTCPRCAETVKSAAVVCKHCGYEFGTSFQPAASAPIKPEKKKSAVRTGCAVVIGLIIILAVIGSPSGPSKDSSSDKSASSATDTAPVLSVTAMQLAAAYKENEVAAQNAYGGKTLDVPGIVTGITLDFMNHPVIQMQGVNEFLPVQASFDDSFKDRLATYSKGTRVTVRCNAITEVISAPMLSDCSLP